MKEKTKDIVTVGGLAVVALGVYYFMAPGAEGAIGGFGGGGGIPLLPGDTEGAAEEDLTTIIYNLPTPPMESPFEPAPEPFVKKTAVVSTLDPGFGTILSTIDPADPLYGTSVDVSPRAWTGYPTPKVAPKKPVVAAGEGRTISQKAGAVVRGGAIEGAKLGVIGTGGGIDFISSIFGLDPGAEATARAGMADAFKAKPKKGITTTPAKTEAQYRSYAKSQVSSMLGDRAYSGFRAPSRGGGGTYGPSAPTNGGVYGPPAPKKTTYSTYTSPPPSGSGPTPSAYR